MKLKSKGGSRRRGYGQVFARLCRPHNIREAAGDRVRGTESEHAQATKQPPGSRGRASADRKLRMGSRGELNVKSEEGVAGACATTRKQATSGEGMANEKV